MYSLQILHVQFPLQFRSARGAIKSCTKEEPSLKVIFFAMSVSKKSIHLCTQMTLKLGFFGELQNYTTGRVAL